MPPSRQRRSARAALAALTVTVGLGATALPASAQGHPQPTLPPNAVAIAQQTPELSILVQAVVKAGLADALAADGNLTVFAPTNDAFVALLGQLGVKSLDDIPVATLRAVLLDHVVTGPYQYWAGNLVEADWKDEAVRLAQEFPWTRYGCIEVRPVRDFAAVRARVGA